MTHPVETSQVHWGQGHSSSTYVRVLVYSEFIHWSNQRDEPWHQRDEPCAESLTRFLCSTTCSFMATYC